jgi:hypothetical protein
MWEARHRRRQDRHLEARLRSARPTPSDEFVRNLTGRVETRRAPRVWSRLAFAAAFTTLLLGTFASFGGLGYAGSGATQAVNTLKTLSSKHKLVVHKSSASAQYPPTPGAPAQGAQPAAQTQVAGAQAAKTLPFTGISLLGTVLASIALIALGLVLRRRERSTS